MPFKKRVVVVEFIAVTSIYLISNVLTVKFCLTRCYTKSENNTFTRLKKDMGFWLLPCAKKFKTKIWHWLSNNLLLKIRTLEKSRIWIFPPKLAKIRNLTHLNLCVKISQNCNCRFLWKIGNQVFEFSRRNCNCRFFAGEKISISENHTLNVRAKIAFVDFCGKTLFFFLWKKMRLFGTLFNIAESFLKRWWKFKQLKSRHGCIFGCSPVQFWNTFANDVKCKTL